MMLVLLALLGTSTVARCALHEFVKVVLSVQQSFASGCVYLLHDEGDYLDATALVATVGKEMFRNYIQTTLSSSGDRLMGCPVSRPLYVVPDKERSIRRNIIQSAIWLKFLETQSLTDYIDGKDVPFNSEFLVAEPGEDNGYVLYGVYRVSPILPLQIYPFGNWSYAEGFQKNLVSFYDRRNNITGAVLRTAYYKMYSNTTDDEGEGSNEEENFFKNVWITLKNIMNFTIDYRPLEHKISGMMLENGSWDGVIGMMQRNEVDVTCDDLSMSPARAEVVDFMIPLLKDRNYVIVKKSESNEMSWTGFLLPFSTGIWVAVIITMLALSSGLWLIYRAGQGHWKEVVMSFSFHDSTFIIFGSFCTQGTDVVPNSMSGKLVFLSSYLTAVILLAGYSGSLISYLTVRSPVFPFTTFMGLLRDRTYKFGVMLSSSIYSFFKETQDPLMRELYRKLIRPREASLPLTMHEGLRRVCEDHKYSFMSTLDNVQEVAANLSCRLIAVPEAFLPGSRAMAVSKGNPYLGLFSHYLLKLRSAGILRRLLLITSKKPPAEESLFVALDIPAVVPMFTILAAGMLTAIFILGIEVAVNMWQKKKDSYATPPLRRNYRRIPHEYVYFRYRKRHLIPNPNMKLKLW